MTIDGSRASRSGRCASWYSRSQWRCFGGAVSWSASSEARTSTEFAIDWGMFWLIQAVYVVAGMAFAVAVRFPFPARGSLGDDS